MRVDGDRLLHEDGRVRRRDVDARRGPDRDRRAGVGIAQAALDTARAYALEREQFGRRISDFQAVQFRLADMATEIAAPRQLTLRAGG